MPDITTENRQFSFNDLQPGKTYRAVVRAFNSQNKRIGRSASIEFKTTGKQVPPPGVQNLTGGYVGADIIVSWEYADRPRDVIGYVISFSKLDGTSPIFYSNNSTSFTLSYIENLNAFGTFQDSVIVSVYAIDASDLISTPATITLTAEPIPDPTNVVISSAVLGYNISWDEPTFPGYSYTAIYESSSSNYSDEELVYTVSSTPNFVPSSKNSSIYVRVAHVGRTGNQSNKVASDPASVIIQNPAVVDSTPPDQRGDISFSAGPGEVTVSWTNPNSEENNLDLAGVAIRYSRSSDPNNFIWVNVPFTFSDNITSYTVTNLLPNTEYLFSLASYDKTQNYTSYSTASPITTEADQTAPPKPVAPSVAVGSSAAGPMTVRISQYAIQDGTGTPPSGDPLPLDTAYFKIFMLDSGFSTSPSVGVLTDNNAQEIGTVISGFNGSRTQGIFFIALEEGESRYFYTRAVDTSGNISDASPATLSSAMQVFSDAYISDLSADKITAGILSASQYIDVGPSSTSRIRIESFDNGSTETGRIFSGLSPESGGGYGDPDTGFYLDHTGLFSLKNRLTFNGTDLSVTGNITASGGTFTGNVGITSGSLWMGSASFVNGISRIVLNSSAIGGYDGSNNAKFILTNSGTSRIGGWTFTTTQLNAPNNGIILNSSTNRITVGTGTNVIGLNGNTTPSTPTGSNTTSPILLWAGTNSPVAWAYDTNLQKVVPGSGSSNLIITESGNIYANNATFSGTIVASSASLSTETFNRAINPSNISLSMVRTLSNETTAAPIPVLEITKIGSGAGDMSFVRSKGTDQGIDWFVQLNSVLSLRASIEHRSGSGTADQGGRFHISAFRSVSDNTPGILLLNAEDTNSPGSDGSVEITSSRIFMPKVYLTELTGGGRRFLGIGSSGRLGYITTSTISSAGADDEISIYAGYKNGMSPNTENRITYGTGTASNTNSNPTNGDIHLRY